MQGHGEVPGEEELSRDDDGTWRQPVKQVIREVDANILKD
jgi:hypothetical protein